MCMRHIFFFVTDFEDPVELLKIFVRHPEVSRVNEGDVVALHRLKYRGGEQHGPCRTMHSFPSRLCWEHKYCR